MTEYCVPEHNYYVYWLGLEILNEIGLQLYFLYVIDISDPWRWLNNIVNGIGTKLIFKKSALGDLSSTSSLAGQLNKYTHRHN